MPLPPLPSTLLQLRRHGASFRARLENPAWLLLRMAFGAMLMTHGVPKMLGRAHGSMADPMAGSVRLIGEVLQLPAAPLIGWCVALLEGAGGLLLVAGWLTRPLAAMVTVQMLVISWLLAPTFAWIDRGFEYPLMLAFVAFFMLTRGAGPVSVDAWLARGRQTPAPAWPEVAR
ncbi:DoxX family protein [Xylophilus sp. GOD-11R]|uniref:DoxX family protein n=1 Tax=Xylophilus sp. GOD-11R TaxID=3089814 RepID=UPI00298BE44C|nr:DoxX family protein [Xylophilus sp. GOD-11R]WPB56976.1 DoxX family protein [Xylophilus sp. GOD-11R]